MDTPQVTAGLLESALRHLADGTVDAVLGPAAGGGIHHSPAALEVALDTALAYVAIFAP